jgi:hypothetical protein
MARVTCGECGHRADVVAESKVWRCNCAAGVTSDPECRCAAVNEVEGDVEPNPPDRGGEIAALEAQLAELRGEGVSGG